MGIFRKIMIIAALAVCGTASAQQHIGEVSVKTNALYDATLSLSLGAEIQVAPKWSIELTESYNGWDIDSNKWRHWIVQPEGRFWLNGEMKGHFFAANFVIGQINVGCFKTGMFGEELQNSRFQGWLSGAGIGYGYAWRLNDCWKLEVEATVGVMHWSGDRFSAYSGHKIQTDRSFTTVAPTKVAVNFAYVF